MNSLKDNIINALFKFPLLSISLLLVFIISRGYEYLITSQIHEETQILEIIGFLYDLFFFFRISAILIIPFIIIHLIRPLAAKLFYLGTIILIAIFHVILVQYFIYSDTLLNANIFDYSFLEVIESIALSEVDLGIFHFLPLALIIIIGIVAYFLLNTISLSKYFSLGFYVIMLAAIIVSSSMSFNKSSLLVYNKSNYFVTNSFDYFLLKIIKPKVQEKEISINEYADNTIKENILDSNKTDTEFIKKLTNDTINKHKNNRIKPDKKHKENIDYVFAIQIMSSNKEGGVSKSHIAKRFKISEPIKETYIHGRYKYTIGEFDKKEDCIKYKAKVSQEYELKGSFIIKIPKK